MITIEENASITVGELEELFNALEWQSGKYGERLWRAVCHSEYHVTARNSDRELIGMITALDDSALNVYIPYALVHPDYQHQGVGGRMMERLKNHYRDFLRITLISYTESVPFYQANGFSLCEEQEPMDLSKFEH